jgi:asparagine synthase (glutamine-hydrolysing)
MVLANPGFFGALDLGGSGDARRLGADLVERARTLGIPTWSREAPPILLGGIGRPPPPPAQAAPSGVSVLLAGEIFNPEELAALAAGPGEGDPELLLARAYAAADVAGLQGANGAFALVLWDEPRRRLVLACDHMGDGKVYYLRQGDTLLFSSTLSLLGGPGRKIDRQAVKEFLRFFYVFDPCTMYAGVSRLSPEACLVAHDGRLSRVDRGDPFRSVHDAASRAQLPAEVQEGFDAVFMRAVRRRFRGRRLGLMLSGGVDSGSLAAAVSMAFPGRTQAFTVGFDDPAADETEAARDIALQLGLPHSVLRFGPDEYRGGLERMSRSFDQPVGDPATPAVVLLAERAAADAEILADGVGADGLFGVPVSRGLRFSVEVAGRLPAGARRLGAGLLRLFPTPARRAAGRFEFDEVEELFITWPGWSVRELRELLGEDVDFSDSRFYRLFAAHRARGTQAVADALAPLPPADERFEAGTMTGRPLIAVFHDPELRAFVGGLPHSVRSAGETKAPLRRFFVKRVKPAAAKRYFRFPLRELLRHHDLVLVERYVGSGALARHGQIDPSRLAPWLARFRAGDDSLLHKIWALVVLHAWLDART